MALVLNEEQMQLRDAARGFFGTEAPVSHLRALRDRADAEGFSRDLWRRCAALGFAGVMVPEALGGVGLGLPEAAVIAEELGRTLTPVPFLSTSVIGATVLSAAADAKRETWLPRIASGDAVVALALDEAPRHRPDRIATTATAAADGVVIEGAKVFVVDGHVADLLIVVAKSGEGTVLVAVDPKADGVTIERTDMVDAHNAARLTFRGVRVPKDAVIASASAAQTVLDRALDSGRVTVAAMLVGAGDAAFQQTMTYLADRTQFGQPIGAFQALQHRAAHLFTELELARSMVMRAVEALATKSKHTSTAVSAAKAKACEAAGLAVQEAVQMHGGIGMTDAIDIGLYMKRVRVLQEWLGDAGYHADRYARSNGY